MSGDRQVNWDPALYNSKHGFVFRFGEDLVSLLDPMPGECILDVGCGTGVLTSRIALAGASVTGIDSSEEMIASAKHDYPDIEFILASGTEFNKPSFYDAIFSNATIHWISEKRKLLENLFNNLKSGGRLVAEFGGKDNVKSIINALKEVLQGYGFIENSRTDIWYFPSLGEYAILLEESGFIVKSAHYFDRNTELKDENGISDWIKMFCGRFLRGMSPEAVELVADQVQEKLRPTNFRDNKWYADYQRLRIVAFRP